MNLPKEVQNILDSAKSVTIPKSRKDLTDLALGKVDAITFDVAYKVNGKTITEATLVRCKNGISVNFPEDGMRRRDPDCLIVADNNPSDKPRFEKVFKEPFDKLRDDTFTWLKKQDLIVTPFMAGGHEYGYPALLIAPKNAAFFALALADLQAFVNIDTLKKPFEPKAIIYLAPPFRHTYFSGKQIVVHNRKPDLYELFSYNLYPGPSAKKGVYGVLLEAGEREGWITAHAAAVKIITPYENEIVIMHEGASGSGKSEMSEPIHRQDDGKILVAQNLKTKKKFILSLDENCELQPISDDMVLCHKDMQNESGRLVIKDGEEGWFVRVDHITGYGTDPTLEKLCVSPPMPLIFLNLQSTPNSTCLIWEHTLDSDGTACPNPRVILPRHARDTIIDEPTEVNVRSFGVRTPPCTKETPSYGIIGMLHILPPAIAWLWRLVAPRGHNNPSIKETKGMSSEGVGSYAPFLTGSIVTQANLLLDQILNTVNTRYLLIPNQHIGCCRVGFMPQWISREYIARRGGAKFRPSHLVPARCTLLGFGLESLKVDGQLIWQSLLQPELQTEVGTEGYDAGAKILTDFFKKELKKYDVPELHPTGKQIIDLVMRNAPLDDYLEIIPMRY